MLMTRNLKTARRFVLLKLTADRHEALCGLCDSRATCYAGVA